MGPYVYDSFSDVGEIRVYFASASYKASEFCWQSILEFPQHLRMSRTYSKKDLFQIMLCGEKPHLPEKFYHNKSIFFSVQTFLCKSKRLLFPKKTYLLSK